MAKLIDITGKALSGEWGTDDETGDGIPVASYSDVYTVEQKLNNLLEGKRELMRNVVIPVDLAITEDELKECLAIHS